MPTNKNFSQQT